MATVGIREGVAVATWLLFVDESGNFDRDVGLGQEQRVVVGVLAQADAVRWLEAGLGDALRTSAPWVPWPPHATLLRRPACHALWAGPWQGTASKRGRQRAGAAIRAREVLEQVATREARELEAALQRRPKAERDRLLRLESAIAGADPSLWPELLTLTEDVRARITEAFVRLSKPAAQGALPRCVLLAAGEAAIGEQPAGRLPGCYLPLLELLLERVADALTALGLETGDREHRVEAHVLGRDVEDMAHGEWLPIDRGHVDQVFDAATGGGPVRHEAGVAVELALGGLHAFDAQARPGLVLADFAANASLGPLASRAGLGVVRRLVAQKSGLPVELRPEVPPLLAAGGDARRRTLAARGLGAPPPPGPARLRRWAVEQADAWAPVLSAWAGARP